MARWKSKKQNQDPEHTIVTNVDKPMIRKAIFLKILGAFVLVVVFAIGVKIYQNRNSNDSLDNQPQVSLPVDAKQNEIQFIQQNE